MANSTGGSFIPKRSTGKVSPVRSGKRIYILSYVAYVLFFGTLFSVVGIFFLHNQAETKLQEYVTLVDEKRQSFQNQNDTRVSVLKELDKRLTTAEQILNLHAAPSIIFDALEDVIVSSVQLNAFTYTRETGRPPSISFTGLTDSFDVLLFQREIMSQSSLLASAEILNVSYGSVTEPGDTGAAPARQIPQTETTVTFTFENASSFTGIGYTPRVFNREVDSVIEESASEQQDIVTSNESDSDALEIESQ